MNRLILIILFVFISATLIAQPSQSIDIGLGAGAATTYAGAAEIKTTAAYNGTFSYYPSKYFDLSLEGQIGTLAGGNPHTTHLNFVNKYQAAFLEGHLHLNIFFDDPQSAFADFLSNTYVGTGFGFIHNRVTQINFTVDYGHNHIPVVPVKMGYIWAIKDRYDDDLLKINFSYSVNPTFGRGIDGYFGPMPQAQKFYVYYAVTVEYSFDLAGDYGGRRIKF